MRALSISSLFALSLMATSLTHAAEPIRVQALQLLQENKLSKEEFHKLAAGKTPGDCVVTEGNYGSVVTEGNYADVVTAGNYASVVTAGNYGNVTENAELGNLPSPIISAQ